MLCLLAVTEPCVRCRKDRTPPNALTLNPDADNSDNNMSDFGEPAARCAMNRTLSRGGAVGTC